MEEQNKLTGVKEIGRRANVSLATVDRVIHNRGGVSKKTREKIELIIKELNYQPNILARRLASPKKIKLATLIPKVSEETHFWESPRQGILLAEAEVKQYGVDIEKYFFDLNDKESFIHQSELILQKRYDAILIAPLFVKESIRFISALQEQNIPFIFIDSDIPGYNSLSYIGPDLYHSGYVVAHLVSYLVKEGSKILVVNIAREIEINHPFLRIEEGFRNFVVENQKNYHIIEVEIKQTDYSSVETSISKVLNREGRADVIFVTSSRVSTVANYLEKSGMGKETILIGFDFLNENVRYLQSGIIDFLICHKPKEQAYRGIHTLFQYLVSDVNIEKVNLMPIDIITKENARFYKE
jgi:LacI family transcriptional regulator